MSKQVKPTFKQKIGCWLHERWRAELMMLFPEMLSARGFGWEDLKNRSEIVSRDDLTGGRVCHWRDSSVLTVGRTFPAVGARILHHVLRQWPVRFASEFNQPDSKPEVSFVIAVRGTGRLSQFQTTLASLMGQEDCATEIVVVEQSWQQEFQPSIPAGVRYVHTPISSPEVPFNRSWALNVGARAASGRVVVLHDGDYVVPSRFARAVAECVDGNVVSTRLPRLIFYLDQEESAGVQETRSFASVKRMQRIVQNNPTPMALSRESYLQIGGHDEAFYGWGGEDNEFLDRARTLEHCEGAFLPVIHLWHPEAPNRSGDRNRDSLDRILQTPAAERIRMLVDRDFGENLPSAKWHVDGPSHARS